MKSVNVRELKNNPSNALRLAREDMVVVAYEGGQLQAAR